MILVTMDLANTYEDGGDMFLCKWSVVRVEFSPSAPHSALGFGNCKPWKGVTTLLMTYRGQLL